MAHVAARKGQIEVWTVGVAEHYPVSRNADGYPLGMVDEEARMVGEI